jgi:enterochelin esterase-like enzyme
MTRSDWPKPRTYYSSARGNPPPPSSPSILPIAVAVALTTLAILFWRVSGMRAGTQGTLIDMGFDPGRAELLGALLIGSVVAAIVGLALDKPGAAIFLGTCTALLDDVGAFRHDTTRVFATGAQGSFDLIGWLLTGLAIVAAALVVAWATATLARPVRSSLLRSWSAIVALRRGRPLARSAVWPAGVAGVLVAFLVLGPVFGDLVNYGTDTRMRGAAAAPVGLFGGVATPQPTVAPAEATGSPGPSPSATTAPRSVAPSGLIAGPERGTYVTPDSLSSATPWTSSVPKGQGRTMRATTAAFWTGGSTNPIDVYLPPGYDTSRSRRYPVVYELPYELSVWKLGTGVTSQLDSLITSGRLPPMIMVFVWGVAPQPYRDTECSNSKDGRERFDTYMVATVVPWVDKTFRTVKSVAARTTMGSSKGGYCSASVATHHPDVFGSSISYSGYFTAGLVSSQTQGADVVFGRDQTYENSQSPILRLAGIPQTQRHAMFFVQVADPSADIYGKQMLDFAAELSKTETPQAFVPSSIGHGWGECRAMLPTALRLVVARQVQLGVYAQTG